MDEIEEEENVRKTILIDEIKRKQQELSSDTVIKDYLISQTASLYSYINNTENKTLFVYFMLGIVIFVLVNKINFGTKQAIAFVFTVVIIIIINNVQNTLNVTDMKEIELKLNNIVPHPKNFYYDSAFIELFFSIRDLRQFNNSAHDLALSSADTFLKIKMKIKNSLNPSYIEYKQLHSLKVSILNNLSSIIFNLPTDEAGRVLTTKLRIAIKSIHLILVYHIDEVKEFYNNLLDPDNLSYTDHIIEDTLALPNDTAQVNPHYNIY